MAWKLRDNEQGNHRLGEGFLDRVRKTLTHSSQRPHFGNRRFAELGKARAGPFALCGRQNAEFD